METIIDVLLIFFLMIISVFLIQMNIIINIKYGESVKRYEKKARDDSIID